MSARLADTFARLRSEGRTGLFPYLTVGFPDRATCARLLDVIASSGADGLELGIPFSDPLADGVTIQRASARALEQHVTLGDALDLVRTLRRAHELPVIVMSYLNPLLAYGFDRFCADAADAGLDAVIIPDVPFEESAAFQETCRVAGLDYVHLVAPTSGPDRLALVRRRASGFVYCVALVGTTGARSELGADLPAFLAEARAAIQAPLVAGFGIATPAHVAALANHVDGVIVASALIDLIQRTDPSEVVSAVAAFVRELAAATARPAIPVER